MVQEILELLPEELKKELSSFNSKSGINEIRLRVGRNATVVTSNTEYITKYIVSVRDLLNILVIVSKNSLYAIQNDINNGFVTIKGGHRIGICGEVVVVDSKIHNIKNINSMNIRVARQIFGASDKILPHIIKEKKLQNTLIISPPGAGKTTMLRDAIRQISNGVEYLEFKGVNVGLIDERGEIAAVNEGIPFLDVGKRTDILSNVEKSIGIQMVLRSMGVSVIATDEIGSKKDIEATEYALLSGVKMLFTMHGNSLKDVMRKDDMASIIRNKVFDIVVILSNKNGVGTIEDIIEFNKN